MRSNVFKLNKSIAQSKKCDVSGKDIVGLNLRNRTGMQTKVSQYLNKTNGNFGSKSVRT